MAGSGEGRATPRVGFREGSSRQRVAATRWKACTLSEAFCELVCRYVAANAGSPFLAAVSIPADPPIHHFLPPLFVIPAKAGTQGGVALDRPGSPPARG